MISLQKQFLFVHFPKTGGNSLQNILRHYSEDDILITGDHQDGLERFEVRNKYYPVQKHSKLSDYKAFLEPHTYDSLYSFSVIRNPWDRMISYYFSPNLGHTSFDRNRFINLVRNVSPLRYFILENPPDQFLDDPNELDADIDLLLKFEQLDQDFQNLCQKLHIDYTPLPKRNASKREHYSHYYDEQLAEFVGIKFRDEVAYGNYSFEQS